MAEMTIADLPQTAEEMHQVIERAQAGDIEALPVLRDILDKVPSIRDLLGADMERTVRHSICKALCGENDLAFSEVIEQKLTAMRAELGGPAPTPTERLLVDRVAACWLQIQDADIRYAQAVNCTLAKANYLRKRQDSANRRYLQAIKTLAQVRKLALPVLQVNVGAN